MSTETGSGTELTGPDRHALPDHPGVYLFRDRAGKVIYVGKAVSVRKRVASHFGAGGNATMTADVASIDSVIVESEAEALLAEQAFIKQYRPRFNIRLRDQERAERVVEQAEAALTALEDELADPASWSTRYEAAKSEARHTAAKRAVDAAYAALEILLEP